MDNRSTANRVFAPQALPAPENYFRTYSVKRSKPTQLTKLTKQNPVFAPQRLPKPENYFRTFSAKRSSPSKQTKPTRVFAAQPLPPPQNYLKTFSPKRDDTSSVINFLEKKKKCPEGSRKNRKTKLCEPLSQILQKVKRKYTKSTLQRCGKGTYRNKLTNNCEPKKLWTKDII